MTHIPLHPDRAFSWTCVTADSYIEINILIRFRESTGGSKKRLTVSHWKSFEFCRPAAEKKRDFQHRDAYDVKLSALLLFTHDGFLFHFSEWLSAPNQAAQSKMSSQQQERRYDAHYIIYFAFECLIMNSAFVDVSMCRFCWTVCVEYKFTFSSLCLNILAYNHRLNEWLHSSLATYGAAEPHWPGLNWSDRCCCWNRAQTVT